MLVEVDVGFLERCEIGELEFLQIEIKIHPWFPCSHPEAQATCSMAEGCYMADGACAGIGPTERPQQQLMVEK